MSHPLESIANRRKVFVWLLIATALLSFAFRFIGPENPNIVQFELAGNTTDSQAIVDAWGLTAQQTHAGVSLGIDYLFMPTYSTALALACVLAAGVLTSKRWRSIGIALAWGAWLAAIFDATENFALIKILFGLNAIEPWPQIAAICATIKFALIAIGVIYAFIGGLARLMRRNNSQTIVA
jgi:hypothetical protein